MLRKSNNSYCLVKNNISLLFFCCCFFTGLTSLIFEWLLTKLSDNVECICQNIPPGDHLLMVLLKIRMGLTNADLSYRFIATSTVLSIYCSCILVMAKWSNGKMVKLPRHNIYGFLARRLLMLHFEVKKLRIQYKESLLSHAYCVN